MGDVMRERDDRTIPGNLDTATKPPSFSVYLDVIMKELFKVCAIEDTICCRDEVTWISAFQRDVMQRDDVDQCPSM